MEKQPQSMEAPIMSKEQAVQAIMGMSQEELRKGATDSEPADFQRLAEQVQSGDLSPEAGVERARQIGSGRMDYH